MKVTFSIISYFLTQFNLLKKMSNVMVNPKNNKFISGWLLEGEQLENMIRGGSL